MAKQCLAESQVKTLLSLELCLATNNQVVLAVQMPFLENILSSTSTASSTSHADHYLAFSQTSIKPFKHHQHRPNIQVKVIEDITRWREDMNFMFEWQEQYLTSERSERVRYCSCHEKIKFISLS